MHAGHQNQRRVILVTLDGVRPAEFTRGHRDSGASLFPKFWTHHAGQCRVFGADPGTAMHASHPSYISLPCYQTMFTGQIGDHADNHAPRVGIPTVFQTVRHGLGLDPEQVAVFASWEKIALAVTSKPGEIFCNAGMEQVPAALGAHPAASLQFSDRPVYKECRKDRYTFELAMGWWLLHKPRLLYISLTDSDDLAHYGSYEDVAAALLSHDSMLDEIFRLVSADQDLRENTLIMVTTDHGRGHTDWRNHHSGLPECRDIWMILRTPGNQPLTASPLISHLDMRSIMESWFDIAPLPALTGN